VTGSENDAPEVDPEQYLFGLLARFLSHELPEYVEHERMGVCHRFLAELKGAIGVFQALGMLATPASSDLGDRLTRPFVEMGYWKRTVEPPPPSA
jgi:hypothetical protein